MDIVWSILAAGIVLNTCDVGVTLMFAARAWTAELQRQGIAPNPMTPPFYIAANFLGAAVLALAIATAIKVYGPTTTTALAASVCVWATTRLYGLGHVVMRQMPMRIFAIMSTGLGLGYLAAGQVLLWLMR